MSFITLLWSCICASSRLWCDMIVKYKGLLVGHLGHFFLKRIPTDVKRGAPELQHYAHQKMCEVTTKVPH